MKKFHVFFLLLTASFSFGQDQLVSGKVFDLSRQPVVGAKLLDIHGNALCEATDESGAFSFEGKVGDRFGIDKYGYDLVWKTIENGVFEYKIMLDVKIQEIELISISRQTSQEALDIRNVNIIDYQPLNGCILTLKKEKTTYYLGLDSIQKQGISFPLTIERPRELFFDCNKSAYILSADSAFQYALLDSGLVILAEIGIEEFDQYIRPCVSRFDNRLVFRSYSDYNKSYDLVMYDSAVARPIFNRKDKIGYQMAWESAVAVGQNVDPIDGDTLANPVLLRQQQRRKVYGVNDTGEAFERSLYEQELAASKEQIAAMSTFNTDTVMPRRSNDNPFGSPDAWSMAGNWEQNMAAYMIYTQPIKMRTFQIGNFMAIVDYDTNRIYLLDHYGYEIKRFDFELSADIKNILQDRSTQFLYLFAREGGNYKVYGLNAFTGQVMYLKNFGKMPHTEQAVVYDNYLYYKVLDRDFFGIERVRLPEMKFFE